MTPETKYGVLAQLVERQVRNLKVRGSIPLCSTEEGRPDGLPSSVEHPLISLQRYALLSLRLRSGCRLRCSILCDNLADASPGR